MAREEEVGNREMGMGISNFQNDLMRRFVTPIQFSPKIEDAAEEEEEIELSLGLSLNGRFGVDPKKLARSASVVDFSMIHHGPVKEEAAPLMRTCSLPTETEEEWRKRKELQTLRRMEAKRKRAEKQMNLRSVKRVFGGEENCDGDKVLNGFFTDKVCGGGFEGLPPQAPSSQGSIGSLGSGSSGISDFDSQTPIQDPVGMNKCSDAASPSSVHSLTECEQKPAVTTRTMITEKQGKFSGVVMKNASEKVAVAEKEGKNGMKNVLENMPCVSTKGDGPDGIRIEGFLYRYRKGEEVKIMCVCHGSFLSPAEFVKHAGGGDVEHPLKHIVVSSSFL